MRNVTREIPLVGSIFNYACVFVNKPLVCTVLALSFSEAIFDMKGLIPLLVVGLALSLVCRADEENGEKFIQHNF